MNPYKYTFIKIKDIGKVYNEIKYQNESTIVFERTTIAITFVLLITVICN